jgi:hypothetical protein
MVGEAMIDEEILGFMGCAGLIPYYMNRIVRDTFTLLEDFLRRNNLIFPLTGLYSIHVEARDYGGEIVALTVLHGRTCLEADLLDASPLSYTPGHGFPPQIMVADKSEVKHGLGKLLGLHGLSRKDAGRLLKKGVSCTGKGCYYSNYGEVMEEIGYLTLSIECRGNSLVFKTMDPADRVFSTIYETIKTLIESSAHREKIRIDKNDLEETIAHSLFNTLKWYIRKYRIIIPGEAEKLGFFTELV